MRRIVFFIIILIFIIGIFEIFNKREPEPPTLSTTQKNVLESEGLFTYISKVDDSQLEKLNDAAWNVKLNIKLLTDPTLEGFALNLFDSGLSYATKRAVNSNDICNNTRCSWSGSSQCTEQRDCTPAESITIVISDGYVIGTIQTISWTYEIKGSEEQGYVLTKGVQPNLPD